MACSTAQHGMQQLYLQARHLGALVRLAVKRPRTRAGKRTQTREVGWWQISNKRSPGCAPLGCPHPVRRSPHRSGPAAPAAPVGGSAQGAGELEALQQHAGCAVGMACGKRLHLPAAALAAASARNTDWSGTHRAPEGLHLKRLPWRHHGVQLQCDVCVPQAVDVPLQLLPALRKVR